VLWNRALPILPTRVRADSEGNVVLLSDVVYGYSGVSLAGGTYDFGCGALKVEYMGVVAAVLDGSGVCRSDYVSESVGGFIRGLDVAPSGDRFAWVIGGFAGEVLFENGYRTGTRTYDSNPHGEDSQDVFVERFDF
jgi:surface antigen